MTLFKSVHIMMVFMHVLQLARCLSFDTKAQFMDCGSGLLHVCWLGVLHAPLVQHSWLRVFSALWNLRQFLHHILDVWRIG